MNIFDFPLSFYPFADYFVYWIWFFYNGPFNLQGWLWVFFRSEFVFSDMRVRIFTFFVAQSAIFFPEINIRLYDKNSESYYFFSLHQNQNIFSAIKYILYYYVCRKLLIQSWKAWWYSGFDAKYTYQGFQVCRFAIFPSSSNIYKMYPGSYVQAKKRRNTGKSQVINDRIS